MATSPVTMREHEIVGEREFNTVAALFKDHMDAGRAVTALHTAGFTNDQVGVALRDRNTEGQLIQETGAGRVEGVVSGALGGGLLGGLTGFLAGLVAAILIPGVGPIVVGGTLASALAAAGGTAVAGVFSPGAGRFSPPRAPATRRVPW